jgi:hypothetical protein
VVVATINLNVGIVAVDDALLHRDILITIGGTMDKRTANWT